jgi:tight adherence protein B
MIRRLRRRCWWRGAPFVFAAVALALAPTALAGAVRVVSVDASGFPLVRATVVAPAGAKTPRLTENGHATAGLVAVNLGQEKAIVLALDRSQSMRGRPLAEAVTAAQSFAHAARSRDHVSVVAFGSDAIGLTRASATAADASDALGGMTVDAHSGTALYDAIVLAARQLSSDQRPGRAIVVVTDGHDVSSEHSLADAVTAARAARAAVYTIGIGGPSFTPDALRLVSRETGGSYHQAANAAALRGVYASLAGELARTWQLSYVTALRPGATLRVKASVPGAGSASADGFVPGASTGTAAPTGLIPSFGYTTAGSVVIALLCGGLVLLSVCFWFASRRGDRIRARIEPHLATGQRAAKSRRTQGASARAQISDGLESLLGDLRQFKRLQLTIERADLPLRAGELVAMCAVTGIFCGLIAAVAAAGPIMILTVMFAFGCLPVAWVSVKASNRMKQFENQLPDLLITIAASLKAGHSFRQSIQAVVDEGAEPAAKEFRRVMTETQLGKSMDDALGDLAARVGSKNLRFVINAVTIQRQVGGSLAGLFDMVADTVRLRQQFLRKVKGLTAMGRMSAYVLVGLPIFIGVVVTMMNPTYMSPLWHSSSGHTLVITGVVMMVIGSALLKKIVSFRG